MEKPNNPPVFPMSTIDGYNHDGMTLRDYFANSAMQAMISAMYQKNEKVAPDIIIERMELISVNAYWYADSMLKQREPCQE